MPSYDKAKLLRLIEARRRAHLTLSDLGDRAREAKSEANRLRSLINEKAHYQAQRRGHVERLLQIGYAEASGLTTSEIQEYVHQVDGDTSVILETGINAETYRKYIVVRERATRLSEEHAAEARNFHARFGIVQRLIDWVKECGFRDPEQEAL